MPLIFGIPHNIAGKAMNDESEEHLPHSIKEQSTDLRAANSSVNGKGAQGLYLQDHPSAFK